MHWILLFSIAINGYNFKRVAIIPVGRFYNRIVGVDMNHNGLDEIIFERLFRCPDTRDGWVIWEYKGENQYDSVYTYIPSDTFLFIGDRRGIAGDGDKDGLSEICASLYAKGEELGVPIRIGTAVLESPDPHSFPSDI